MFEETKNESLRQLLQLAWDSDVECSELHKKMVEKDSMDFHELNEMERKIHDYPVEIRETFFTLKDIKRI